MSRVNLVQTVGYIFLSFDLPFSFSFYQLLFPIFVSYEFLSMVAENFRRTATFGKYNVVHAIFAKTARRTGLSDEFGRLRLDQFRIYIENCCTDCRKKWLSSGERTEPATGAVFE